MQENLQDNSIRKTIEKELKEDIRKYVLLQQDIKTFNTKHQNYLDFLTTSILEKMQRLNIESFQNATIKERKEAQPYSIAQLKRLFNDENMVDYLVVKVLPEMTVENMRLKEGFSDNLIKSYLNIIEQITAYTYDAIEIKNT